MTTILRQVLNTFQESKDPLSLAQVARNLGIEQNMLEGMLEHWVRKGKLREVGSVPVADCPSCSKCTACGPSPDAPRRYELATEPLIVLKPPACDRCG